MKRKKGANSAKAATAQPALTIISWMLKENRPLYSAKKEEILGCLLELLTGLMRLRSG